MLFSKVHLSDALWYRIVLMIGIVAIPLFGVIIKHQLPDSVDYMSHRLLMSAIWLLVLVLSLTSSFFKKRFILITCWLLFLLNIWAIWIVYINNFALDYTMGLLTAFCALNIAFRHPKLYYPFMLCTMMVWIIANGILPNPEADFTITVFSVCILGIVFMLTVNIILNTEYKLNELNMTLEKKVAERTAEAESQAKRLILKNKELEQFAYIASHDLKSPLRNIGSFIQLIHRKINHLADRETNEYMGYVVSNVNKMHTIIEDILLYSRFGDESITFKKTDIESVVQEVCNSMRHELQARNAEVNCDLHIRKIRCNKKQISQLFQNLIDNGLKYNKALRPKIEICMKETSDDFLFSIRDNGIGIEPVFKDKIFKIFQRLHTDREYTGTGIGLAICKRIIENHQGEIWIESTPGKGTTFFFTISKHLTPAGEVHQTEVIAA